MAGTPEVFEVTPSTGTRGIIEGRLLRHPSHATS